MIENTQEIREFVWLQLKGKLISRGIQLDDLRHMKREQFRNIYFEAWDNYILGMGIR